MSQYLNTFEHREAVWACIDTAIINADKAKLKSSAVSCGHIAIEIMHEAGEDETVDIQGAQYHALRSLGYSLGLFNSDYKRHSLALYGNEEGRRW
jgi:hypothetical protein